MRLPSLDDLPLAGKKVLLRADLNVPLANGVVTDDQRIRAVLPTIVAILAAQPRLLVLCSHLGKPKGKPDPALSLAPVARAVGNALGRPVEFLGGPVGVDEKIAALPEDGLAMLENLRFDPGEKAADDAFADALAAPFDAFVLDAFGALHRAHASIVSLPKRLPTASGPLVKREIEVLDALMQYPERPYYALLGGAKLSTKLGVVKNLLERVDGLLIAGGMAYTFLKARGEEIGKSLVDDSYLDEARAVMARAREKGVMFMLPRDHVLGTSLEDTQPTVGNTIAPHQMALDIGPLTRQDIFVNLRRAKTVIWNGPLGAFEYEPYSFGTKTVVLCLPNCEGKIVIGGGDSAAALAKFGSADSVYHVSTGGGASLEFLEGKTLPGVAALQEALR